MSTADNRTVDNDRISGAVYLDASLTYKFSSVENVASEVYLNVRNLTNKDPVVVAPGPGGFCLRIAGGQCHVVTTCWAARIASASG